MFSQTEGRASLCTVVNNQVPLPKNSRRLKESVYSWICVKQRLLPWQPAGQPDQWGRGAFGRAAWL